MARRATHEITEGLPSVDIRSMVLQHGAMAADMRYRGQTFAVRIVWTPCHYGGQRAWFVCPVCGHRRAVLYFANTLLCRTCGGLNYAIQRTTEGNKAFLRAGKLRASLGWQTALIDPCGDRPRYMRRRTYDTLVRELHHQTMAAWAAYRKRMERTMERAKTMIERWG